MRRDIWLAGVAGAIVGSWLTLVAIQLDERGFSLPHRSNSSTTTEKKPTATASSETAKADATPPKAIEAPKPAETTKQGDTNSDQSQPEGQPVAQLAGSAAETTKDKATVLAAASPSTTSSDSSPELSATAMAAAAAATPTSDGDATEAEESKAAAAQQDGKVPTDPAHSNDVSTKPEEPQPTPATTDMARGKDAASTETTSADQAKIDPAPDNRIPADQIDRQTAAAEHRTLQPQQAQAKPQSEQAAIDPSSKPQEQATTIELVRPFSDQAGILTISGRSVQLTGVIPTDIDRMCIGPSGSSWPCGQAARTAFRMYLRGRSIDCDVPDANWKGTVAGACRYVRVDLSAWLVRFGWADPEPGSPLASLVDEAKQKKRGMYGDDPRKNGKSTLAPPLPKENPLNPI
ncbi:thermonuclease family protein [Rhizobium sp. NPDC090279]|uniref:thermonuclease family protein n=1 Tax=Rhizobium sp. NPDC090279 TaxID=3364499 RepID=UPI00383AB0D9